MDHNENETSTTRTVVNNVNGAIVLGAMAYSVYTLGRLTYTGAREGVRALKARKNRQIEN